MKRRTVTLLFLIALCFTHPAPGQTREIVGYYPSWKWHAGKNLMTPEKIPYRELTIINYAFFRPQPDGTITGKDSAGDAVILRGTPLPASDREQPAATLTALAHRNNVRVVLSIGGWDDSAIFPHVASDAARRARFAHSCVTRIEEFGFDGIDIDWEYPCYPDHNGTPQDRANFTRLLGTLRDSLNACEQRAGRHLLLTAALPADSSKAAGMEVQKIAAILDFLNVMTYDFYGPWDPRSNHNAPLYPGEGGDSTRCVDAAFALYHWSYGVPASKINLGVPFYGHAYARCSGLNEPHGGSDTAHFPAAGATFAVISRELNKFTRRWDDRAKVPYLVSPDRDIFVSYDDEESVRYKADYAVTKGVRGLIIWEITGDYMQEGTSPLLDVLYRTIHDHSLKSK